MALALDDIQLPIVRSYGMGYERYLFLAFGSPEKGREWLARVAPSIASGAPSAEKPPTLVNVGFTFEGLGALGISQATLDTFPVEFCMGMARRAPKLGLTGASDPSHWELGGPANPTLHAALFIFAESSDAREAQCAVQRAIIQQVGNIQELGAQDGNVLPNLREHFGYVDGISQPAFEGSDVVPREPYVPAIAPGEFVLGYPDEIGEIPPGPPAWLSLNGSFAAYQKIYQNVAAFRAFLLSAAQSPDRVELVAAKLVGRWRSGAPLVLAPEEDDAALAADHARANAFEYNSTDANGFACPIGSHIRRMNPRDTQVDAHRHRVIRRGLPYGPPLAEGSEDDGVDRGLIGFFLNASLSRQYEFIQQAWANDPKFAGLENDKDPIVGDNDGTSAFTIQRRPIHQRISGVPRFITVKAGSYFFMPGIKALHAIASGSEPQR